MFTMEIEFEKYIWIFGIKSYFDLCSLRLIVDNDNDETCIIIIISILCISKCVNKYAMRYHIWFQNILTAVLQ